MSKFYYDCEFLEGTQKKLFGQTKPTIDLISIGIVSDDDREYYAISKDFNLKEAWSRYDIIPATPTEPKEKVYWIRDNVLKPIFEELVIKSMSDSGFVKNHFGTFLSDFTYHHVKTLINWYGKSNKQIASEIVEFVYGKEDDNLTGLSQLETAKKHEFNDKSKNPVFYAYYGAYDHVALCWLFGKMIDLPKGFPMYSIDLKQMLDDKELSKRYYNDCPEVLTFGEHGLISNVDFKKHKNYPTQQNVHNALDDARFNKKLHEFIQSL